MSEFGTKRLIADEPSRSALKGKADEAFSGPDSRSWPNVWSGRASQGDMSIWRVRSCINVSGLWLERVLRAIMDISARTISLADRPQWPTGSPAFARAGKTHASIPIRQHGILA